MILSSADHRTIQFLFKEPTFTMILRVNQGKVYFNSDSKDVDYPGWWHDKVKIKNILPLSS